MSYKKGRRRKSRISRILSIVVLILIISFLISIATDWSFIYIFMSIFLVYMLLYIYMFIKYRKKAYYKRSYKRDEQTIYHLTDDLPRKIPPEAPGQRKYYVSNTTLKKLQSKTYSASSRTVLKKMSKSSYKNQKNLVKMKNPFDTIKSADFEKDDTTDSISHKENSADFSKNNLKLSWRDLYNGNESNVTTKTDDSEENLNINKEDNSKEVSFNTEYPKNLHEESIDKFDEKPDDKPKYNEIFIDADYPNTIDDKETIDLVNRLDKLLKKKQDKYMPETIAAKLKTKAILKDSDDDNMGEQSVKVDCDILDQIYNEKTEPSMAPSSKNKNIKKPVEYIKNKFFKDAFLEDENDDDIFPEDIAIDVDLEYDYDVDDNVYEYALPTNILKSPIKSFNEFSEIEIQKNAEKLIDTLSSFGVGTKIINISRGPSVTRYEIQPDSGVKVSKIVGLADDIALNLASSGVRIEAPIPGKAAVGVEVPNKEVDIVNLYEIINSAEFNQHKSKLAFAVGKDVGGKIIVGDIQKMPHVLIAGATGSGKSVCINTLISSILYKASPQDAKLIMIDPKVVELNIYNGIPHLLIPVVTDPKKAAGALNWAVEEMEKRYSLFAGENVRDIRSYNKSVARKNGETLPLIVIIIDELADLMMVASHDVEDYICRLAQKARAAGLHLIVATQRPSVDVITGLIKANIPSRIAFAVSSQVDSRTIIDMAGAEKLLGRGDMLYYPMGQPKPMRVQGAFVSDKEIEDLVGYIKKRYGAAKYRDDVLDQIEKKISGSKDDLSNTMSDEDESLLNQAIQLVLDHGHASVSFLQRKLKLGYSRAARIIDRMEEMGIVSSSEGSKPRQILITPEEWYEMNT